MTILFVYPYNKRTIPIDIPLFKLKERGHRLFLLTFSKKGQLHYLYEQNGVKTYSITTNLPFPLKQFYLTYNLVKFCRKNQIDTIHSHLQEANLVASFSSPFLESRVNLFRHHCKFHFLVKHSPLEPSLKEVIADKVINALAKRIIVPSEGVKNAMTSYEKVDPKKISIIPYMYDFDSMRNIDLNEANKIRNCISARMVVIMIARHTPFKRHIEGLKPIVKLINEGLDLKVIIMDEGPETNQIQKFLSDNKTDQERFIFTGFTSLIYEYIAASDALIHPSITEASNSVVKECGLFEKSVLVCDKVGDFNDYIKHNYSGFLLEADKFADQAYTVIKQLYENPNLRITIGKRLKSSVKNRFKVKDEKVDLYESL